MGEIEEKGCCIDRDGIEEEGCCIDPDETEGVDCCTVPGVTGEEGCYTGRDERQLDDCPRSRPLHLGKQ